MCGYLGKISKVNFDKQELITANFCQVCRGPDDLKQRGTEDIKFLKKDNFISSFVFNRLSIIDLSEKASQPMVDYKNENIVMFNGEIYNHRDLRNSMEKEGIQFLTNHSDTEVVLNGIGNYGLDFVNKLNGQFSIFFKNSKLNKVFLIRDRLGQKPLFYHIDKMGISFSTNLKSLVKLNKTANFSEEMIVDYLNLGVVPSPNTIFKDYYKVQPGSILSYDLDTLEVNKIKYWDIENHIGNKKFNYNEFVEIFEKSVNLRLESDVPFAAFVSGGLDSTAVIKGIKSQNPVNTFSMLFENEKYNEEIWSNAVANKYKTIHTTSTMSKKNNFNDLQEVVKTLDEPYADISLIPTYLLSKEISKHYKVAISGDGGDELLFGYEHSNKISANNANSAMSFIYKILYAAYPARLGSGNQLLSKLNNIETAYKSFFEDRKLLSLLNLSSNFNFDNYFSSNTENPLKKIMVADYRYYLSEMMLLKIDRASMANSLEIRSPFVDHKLVEYILSSDTNYIEKTNPKAILKNYINTDFNSQFLNRKKMGFAFDMENWVYGNLNTVKEVIKEGSIINSINPKIVNQLAQRPTRINSHRLWKLLLLELYIKNNG